MYPVIITVYPVTDKMVPMEIEGLPQYLVNHGEVGKQQLIVALEALVRHIKHGSSLLPTAEMVQ